MAEPVGHIGQDTKFEITCFVYGSSQTQATLFEDDGTSFNYEKGNYNLVTLLWQKNKGIIKRSGQFKNTRYVIKKWQLIN